MFTLYKKLTINVRDHLWTTFGSSDGDTGICLYFSKMPLSEAAGLIQILRWVCPFQKVSTSKICLQQMNDESQQLKFCGSLRSFHPSTWAVWRILPVMCIVFVVFFYFALLMNEMCMQFVIVGLGHRKTYRNDVQMCVYSLIKFFTNLGAVP